MPTAGELTIVLEAQDRASAQLQQVGAQVARLERQVEGVQRSTRGGGLLGALTGGLGVGAGLQAVNQALGGVGGVVRFITESVFDLNSSLERSVATFESLTGSAAAARDVVQALRREAAVSPFNDEQLLAAGRALITSARGSTESLLELVRVAEQLAAIDPAQGLEGAAFALREALGGDFESLIQRFEISRQSIARFRAEGLTGLQVVTAALREMGVGSEIVERLGRTLEGRIATIQSFGNELRQRLGAGIFERVSDVLGRVVRLIDQYGDRLREWAEQVGVAIGSLLERFVSRFVGPLLALLDRLAPGLREVVEGALAQAPEQMEAFAQRTAQAAQAGETLERQLGRLGVEAATLQLEANRVRRTYDDQLEPLQRQLRLLQQSADLQRVQNALATNRATVEGLRLEREVGALQRAARGQEDPNAPGLSARQRAIALALQERRLRLEELGLTEQQRPAVQALEAQIAALQEQQRAALEPLERQLALRREEIDVLQIARQQQQVVLQEMADGAQRVNDTWKTLKNDPETLANAKRRGEELADEWITGMEDFINNAGTRIWEGILGTFRAWYAGGGKEALAQQAATVGADVGGALADALGAELRRRFDALLADPRVAGIVGGATNALGGAFPVLPQVAAGVTGIPNAGLTVEFGTGAITIGGINDPGFGERLKAALTTFLQAFVLTGMGTDAGASARQQGAGRAP